MSNRYSASESFSDETEGSHRVTVVSEEGTSVVDSSETPAAVAVVTQPAARKKSNLVAAMSTSNTNALSAAAAAAPASSFSLQSNGAGAAELTAALGNSEMTRRAAAIGALEVNERSENDAIDLDFEIATESQQGDIFSKTWKPKSHEAPKKTAQQEREEAEEAAALQASLQKLRQQEEKRRLAVSAENDEFNSEFTDAPMEPVAPVVAGAPAVAATNVPAVPERKRLKASARQTEQDAKQKAAAAKAAQEKAEAEIALKLEAERKRAEEVEAEAAAKAAEIVVPIGAGIQVEKLAAILPPTHILDQYMHSNAASVELSNVEAAVAAEWDSVQELRVEQAKDDSESALQQATVQQQMINMSYQAAETFFAKQYPFSETQKGSIVRVDVSRLGYFAKLKHMLLGPPKLQSDKLESERDLFLTIAKVPMEYSQAPSDSDARERILQSIYCALTGDRLPPRRFGSHWEQLGFQGSDPATDLRGAGMLGLFQLMYFVRYYNELALKIFRFSHTRDTADENFPFCLISFKFTGICMQVLRQCTLYDTMDQANSVMIVMHNLYLALFYEFYLACKQRRLTIRDFETYIGQTLAPRASEDPLALITAFQASNQPIKSEIEEGMAEFGAVEKK